MAAGDWAAVVVAAALTFTPVEVPALTPTVALVVGVVVVPVEVTAVALVLRAAVVVMGALVVVGVVDWFVLGLDAGAVGVVTDAVLVTFPTEAVEVPFEAQIRPVLQMSIMARTAHALPPECAIVPGGSRPPGILYS